MNITKLLEDYSVQYWTQGNNVSPGWVNVKCVFCDDTSNHLGYDLHKNYFHCWRCGGHKTAETIQRMLNLASIQQANEVIRIYGGSSLPKKDVDAKVNSKRFKLPPHLSCLKKSHRHYLERRNFDPDKIERLWKVTSTKSFSYLDQINYSHRILIPFFWEGEIVTFQARDITDQAIKRYLACPKNRERIHHKDIIYGNQKYWKDKAIIVEGVTDVWRLGPISIATLGIKFTDKQVLAISKRFKEVLIVFDEEPQARREARRLRGQLSANGLKTSILTIQGDPGDMSQDDAKALTYSFIKDKKFFI